MTDPSQPVVPKFGSFVPRAKVSEVKQAEVPSDLSNEGKDRRLSRDEREKDKSRHRHRDHHHHHHREHRSSRRDRSPRRERSPRRDRSTRRERVSREETSSKEDHVRESAPISEFTTSQGEMGPKSSDIFIEDRVGDPKNLVYGSLDRYSIPAFHRSGRGNILGVGRRFKIVSEDEKGMLVEDIYSRHSTKRQKYVFASNEKQAVRLLKVRPEAIDHGQTESLDFILVNPSKKRKRRASNDPSSEDEDTHYRSIQGKAKASNKPADDQLEYATESDSSGSESGRFVKLDASTRQKTIELSRAVEQQPQNLDAWLALIDHQDSLLGIRDNARRKITRAEKQSTAEIKMSMYEKALTKAASTLEARERLLSGLMDEGSKVWDIGEQSRRWEQIVKENIGSHELRKKFLDFKQSTFSTFQFEDVRDIYINHIRLLRDAARNERQSLQERENLYEQVIYTLLRATLYLREAGYTEFGTAIWQSLLEANFFAPTDSSINLEDAFRDFWESEVAKIGEPGALGWQHYHSDPNSAIFPEARTDPTPTSLESSDIFGSWSKAEKTCGQTSREPARTLDDVAENDPFRVILASDIEPFLVFLPVPSSSLRELLLDAYLMFCRLPPARDSDSRSYQWWKDQFIRGSVMYWGPQLREQNLGGGRNTDHAERYEAHSCPPPEMIFTSSPDTMFQSPYWYRSFKAWREVYGDQGPLTYEWVRNSLRSIVNRNCLPGFAEYYLGFEYCNESETIKKTAKSVLKQYPSSLRLYNAYACIEWSRGNQDTALNTIHAAIGMRNSVPEAEQKHCIFVWKTWAWGLLDRGHQEEALKCLLAIPDGNPDSVSTISASSPAALLKAEQHLTSIRDYLLSSNEPSTAIVYTECLALLSYLSTQTPSPSHAEHGNITAALSVFDSFSTLLISRSLSGTSHHELLLQSAARLLYHHARHSPFRPSLIRAHLETSLSYFPSNTIFLSLYAWNERHLRIDARVRSLLSQTLIPAHDNVILRLFAIWHEQRVGNVHSVRAAFENAVSSPQFMHNAGIWKLYVLFCAENEEYRGIAKDVFYRGLRACPWVKRFVMVAFENLREVMGMGELREVYKVLGEKELRVHVDLEEQLEQLDER